MEREREGERMEKERQGVGKSAFNSHLAEVLILIEYRAKPLRLCSEAIHKELIRTKVFANMHLHFKSILRNESDSNSGKCKNLRK